MANKVMSLHDAVEKYVCDNDVLCLGGFTTNRKPNAAVYEILRQGKTGFVGWSGPAGGDWDALIGEGRVRAYINCYTANSGYTNVARRFRAAIEKGELTYEDYSQDVLMLQLHAASLGLPYLPVRMMQGSGLVKFWGISEEKRRTMEGVDNLKCAEIENPFEPGEKLLAVPVPKLDCAIIHVQQASPDGTCIIEGDEFHDVDIAIAAKRTIVTCEEIVSDEYIRRDPTKTRIFGECVDAVVRAPYGAWPAQCYGYYDDDDKGLKEYDKASKYLDAEDAKAQLQKAADKAVKDMGVNATIDEVCTAGDAGYVITTTDKDGFGGNIQITVGIKKDGTINGVSILSISETAGLGMKATEPSFYNQYVNKQADKFVVSKDGGDGEQIDALSGATITSRAVTGAVNAALGYYQNAFK